MGLVMVSRSGPPMAMHCPAVVCDACGILIQSDAEDVNSGNVIWAERRGEHDRYQTTPLYFVHKRCDHVFNEVMKEEVYPWLAPWRYFWQPLNQFLKQASYNVSNRFGEDPEDIAAEDSGAEVVYKIPSVWEETAVPLRANYYAYAGAGSDDVA